VLARLDPVTLRPARHADARAFGSGAAIAGSGSRVLWVRAPNRPDLLACVSAESGRIEQRWHLSGVSAVSSGRDGALAATRSGVLGLIMAGCRG
jgi:hypothetical protein